MLLNAVPKSAKKTKVVENTSFAPPWWVNPFSYCLYILLPLFIVTIITASPYMDKLGQRVNNMSVGNTFIGLLSIIVYMTGCAMTGKSPKTNPANATDLSIPSVNLALGLMGSIALLCGAIYFIPLLMNPMALIKFFIGDTAAMYEIRQQIGKIPGITSFMAAGLPFISLYSAVTLDKNVKIKRLNRIFFILLFVMYGARAVIASERLALIEGMVAYGVPRAAFVWRPGPFRTYLPLIGFVGIFLLFCLGEYFRSWQYYKRFFDSYWNFISVRFFGYFITSINNGAGMITYYPPVGLPLQTVTGFYSLLRVFGLDLMPDNNNYATYLERYSTPEFNNPGGLYVPYMDFGILGGLVVFFLMGCITGTLFKLFMKRRPLGLLLYAPWYCALLDIMRQWIWGNSRFVPVLITAIGVSLIVYAIPKVKPNLLGGNPRGSPPTPSPEE